MFITKFNFRKNKLERRGDERTSPELCEIRESSDRAVRFDLPGKRRKKNVKEFTYLKKRKGEAFMIKDCSQTCCHLSCNDSINK